MKDYTYWKETNCIYCDRQKTEFCHNCQHDKGCPMYMYHDKPDNFLISRHLTIIDIIDKCCEMYGKCDNCIARSLCNLYVIPDLIKKVDKIKGDKTFNIDKLTDGIIKF